MLFIDDLFDMKGGFVLNFSDRTFGQFFAQELEVDIDHPRYARDGTSKAKRLRCFLQISEPRTAARALQALWDYREAMQERSGAPESITDARRRFLQLLERVSGPLGPAPSNAAAAVHVAKQPSPPLLGDLLAELTTLPALAPQPRGYAFERLLKRLFDAYGLEARDPFKLTGEQIDGSFQLSKETYLLEAKWQTAACGVADLHAFHGKLDQKAAWTRGLFISNSGFSQDGLAAFGRGKRLVCMDGYDLFDALSRRLALPDVLDLKVRRAAETGAIFVRVRDLFPM